MLKTKIKAGSITNLTDARYFAAWEVEWLGFNLTEGEDTSISPAEVLAIKEWVEGPKIVGEFNVQTTEEIKAAIEALDLDCIQVGPFTSVETLIELQSPVPIIKSFIIEGYTTQEEIEELLEEFAPHVTLFLIDMEKNGFNWEDLQNAYPLSLDWLSTMADQYPMLLSIGKLMDNMDAALSRLPLQGIHVRGGEEEKVGYKSFDELDAIFEALETFD